MKSYISSLVWLMLGIAWTTPCAADWPQFRGGAAASVASLKTAPPTEWNVAEKRNIAWQVELPGKGPASPIVVGDRIVVTASSGAQQDKLHVVCYAAASGKLLWQRNFWATGRCYSHPQSANAAPTPASDGKRIFAFFSSNDLACLDLEGNLLWYRGLAFDHPKAGNDVGMSSSPLVVDGKVILQVENQGDSFATALAAETGETLWRVAREPNASWCSPTLLTVEPGRPQVLLQSQNRLSVLDAGTGELAWEFKRECQGIPSPAVVAGRIYLPADGLTALDATSTSSDKTLWKANKLGPGAASPVCDGQRIFTVNRAPVLVCASAADGEVLWQLRLKGAFWATPLLVGDLLYCTNFDGQCLVVRAGQDKGEIIATNEFGQPLQGSPAVAEGALYFRSDTHLWKVAANP
jgi:outer membrane protein assembly factor BamB